MFSLIKPTHTITPKGAISTVFASGTYIIFVKEVEDKERNLVIVGYSNCHRQYVEQHVTQDCIEAI
jgi:hypothetical protein